MHTLTPRANFLHEKTLKEIYKRDVVQKEGGELDKYKFGKFGVCAYFPILLFQCSVYLIYCFLFVAYNGLLPCCIVNFHFSFLKYASCSIIFHCLFYFVFFCCSLCKYVNLFYSL
jgi:hypothetical protein